VQTQWAARGITEEPLAGEIGIDRAYIGDVQRDPRRRDGGSSVSNDGCSSDTGRALPYRPSMRYPYA
jgi:hypothetical protein